MQHMWYGVVGWSGDSFNKDKAHIDLLMLKHSVLRRWQLTTDALALAVQSLHPSQHQQRLQGGRCRLQKAV